MLAWYRSLDATITDACAFLEIERPEFFELAAEWSRHAVTFATHDHPEDFYRSFEGRRGRANLCANILDQYQRRDIFDLLGRISRGTSEPRGLIFADIGCGSGALSFDMARRHGEALLVDLPNLAQRFVAWRIARHGLRGAQALPPEAIGGRRAHVVMCVDVLEHIAESSAMFMRIHGMLPVGGMLVLRTPWASVDPHPEHLPEAEADWHKPGGGAALLAGAYQQLAPLPHGGLYQRV